MPGPLHGFTVIDATQMVAGPLAGMVLADMGAEVIKVENPANGDRLRHSGTRKRGMAAMWVGVNRGKRAVCIDLQRAEGVALLTDLVRRADVFIQNFRPGVAERLGIDEPSLRAANPALVYVSISGFGPSGPYVANKSYDYVVQALSGMAALQADPETGKPALVRNIVVDKVTAYSAAQSVLAALLARERGAGGQHVEVAMLDVAVAFFHPDGFSKHFFLDDDGVTEAVHNADQYVVHRTRDGAISVMPLSDRQFPLLCKGLGTPLWLEDPRFASADARDANLGAMQDVLAAEFARYDTADLVARLHAVDVPCAPIVGLDDVPSDPQVVHNALFVEHERPHIGRVREPRPAVRFSATPQALGRHAPRLDEHTDEVLAELGLTPERIAELHAAGVVGRRP